MRSRYHRDHDDNTKTVEHRRHRRQDAQARHLLADHRDPRAVASRSRPMSNNGDVAYDGNSWFFANEEHAAGRRICAATRWCRCRSRARIHLYIAVAGRAHLVRDKNTMRQHWVPDLDPVVRPGRRHSRPGVDPGGSRARRSTGETKSRASWWSAAISASTGSLRRRSPVASGARCTAGAPAAPQST